MSISMVHFPNWLIQLEFSGKQMMLWNKSGLNAPRKLLKEADLVLLGLKRQRNPLTAQDRQLPRNQSDTNRIILLNKTDLPWLKLQNFLKIIVFQVLKIKTLIKLKNVSTTSSWKCWFGRARCYFLLVKCPPATFPWLKRLLKACKLLMKVLNWDAAICFKLTLWPVLGKSFLRNHGWWAPDELITPTL